MGQQRHSFLSAMSIENDILESQIVACRERDRRGDSPGHPSRAPAKEGAGGQCPGAGPD